MNNREYLKTLSDKELAEVLFNKPWLYYINKKYINEHITYIDGLNNWLKSEYKNH